MMERLTKRWCSGKILSQHTLQTIEVEESRRYNQVLTGMLAYRDIIYKNGDTNPFVESIKDKYVSEKIDRRNVRTLYFVFMNELSGYPLDARSKLILFLGSRCSKCGNGDIEYLEIDHIEGDGWEDRKHFKDKKMNIWSYYLLFLEEAAEKLQLLCIDCHKIKTRESGDAWHRRPEDTKLEVIQQ